jgi:hypothetical protein
MTEINSAIRRFALSTTEWTPIVAPINCNYFLIIGSSDGSAMHRCSDPNNAESAYEIPPGGWYSMMAPTPSTGVAWYRYRPGDAVTYLKATAGNPMVFVEFVA